MNKPYFIADIGSNHNQDIERTKALIRATKSIGCDAVKFQLFKGEKLWHSSSQNMKLSKERELPEEFLPVIREVCDEVGLDLVFTPFDLDGVDLLLPYVDMYKIASYELLWADLIKKCASTEKPMIISTGMADMGEVLNAVLWATAEGCIDITLLHCVSEYPANYRNSNLSVIAEMRRYFHPEVTSIGWSDHTVDHLVLLVATEEFHSDVIEFHFDLEDKQGAESKHGHCWTASRIESIIAVSKKMSAIRGDGIKTPTDSELKERTNRTDPSDGLRPMKYMR